MEVLRADAARTSEALADRLAAHALRVTEGGDFAVARDAMDALLRRLAGARQAGAVLSRRRRGHYVVGRREPGAPRYQVWLGSLDPLEGSCSCPDYGKASLGLCKHIFMVALDRRAPEVGPPPALRWDPVKPLSGSGDWLERVRFDGASRLFRQQVLVPRCLSTPAARLATVEALLQVALDGAAEPALLPLLERERDELERIVRRGLGAREVARQLGGLKQKLFLYQREGVRRFLERGRLLLADDMGLGKTAQAIAACHVLVASGRVTRGLIVVPAPLKPQWLREWQRFTDVPLILVDGSPAERARTVRRAGPAVLLVNYEQVIRDLPHLLRFRPEVVVLDEAQRIKNWATKTALHVKRLDADWRLVLTGTPMENRLDELASIMEWVDEQAMEPRWRLASWHSVRADGENEIVGARNLDTLRQRLAPSMVRRVRREVLEQLPPRRDTRVSVALTTAQQAAHDDLSDPIARIVAQARRRPLSQAQFLRLMSLFTRQRILCNGIAQSEFEEVWPGIEGRRPSPAVLDSLASPKLGELRELVSAIAIGQERKIVVFSQWRRMLRLAAWAVSDLLRRRKLRAAFFTGEESGQRRTQNLVEFHDDPAVRVLFATDAGGVGLNLQRAASCCVHLDLPWNPAVLEQRIGRIYRLGQEHPVDVYTLVGETGIEGRIAALVGDKRALFEGLFDGTTDAVEFERAGSFLERIQALVAPELPPPPRDDDVDDQAPANDVDQPDALADEPDRAGDALAAGDAAGGGAVAALFAQIQVRQLEGGRVSFEAPAAAAAALAELLQGVAGLLARPGP
jgi:superfamily II DNA or RNA helicase